MTIFTPDTTLLDQVVKDYPRRQYQPKHTKEEIMFWEGQQSVIESIKRRRNSRDTDQEIIR